MPSKFNADICQNIVFKNKFLFPKSQWRNIFFSVHVAGWVKVKVFVLVNFL